VAVFFIGLATSKAGVYKQSEWPTILRPSALFEAPSPKELYWGQLYSLFLKSYCRSVRYSDLNATLYADYIALLQSGLDKLNESVNERQLSVAINKCSVLHNGNNNPGHNFNLQSVSLHNATEATDLGIILEHKPRFLSS